MLRADVALISTGLAEHALRAGDVAPEFTLREVRGNSVSLSTLRRSGPVVINFYRGDWCPYCVLELEELAALHPEIDRLGASVVAISPQKVERLAAYTGVPFALASDPGSKVARAYGLAFSLPEELRPIYQRLGHPLPAVNAASDWVLPLPATYVVARDGRIALSFVDADYRRRMEPSEILAALSGLPEQSGRSPWRT
jgi:peroxiredoxin